jgi:phosphocarrier protein
MNRQGIHARPAHLFVRTANEFSSEILVIREGAPEVNGKSMMGMLTLAAAHGAELIIRASGPDAYEAVTALEGLFLAGFGEE